MARLFPADVPYAEWQQFAAEGFQKPVCGIIFCSGETSRGMPLGGIGTGCIDLNGDGRLGLCSIFNSFVPPRDLNSPLLQISLDGESFPLTPSSRGCTQIHYWGHYPIADIEYELTAEANVGMRTWCPILLGNSSASNTPAIFMDVQVRNASSRKRSGRLTCGFPGPSQEEAVSCSSTGVFSGVLRGAKVSWEAGGYVLCILDPGAELGSKVSWENPDQRGTRLSVEFDLEPHAEQKFQFILAWYMPRWAGSPAHHFRHAYASRFSDVMQVAEFACEHKLEWLVKITAWQSVIYNENGLPVWLRDQLVNVLHTITEDSFWAAESIPSENWYRPEGLFALTESPRTTPHICNPSDWYGILPIAFFFPDLMKSLLRLYVHFQLPTGEVPLGVGEGADLFHPSYHLFQVMNSCVHIQLIDRLWQRTQSSATLDEFYPSAAKALEFMGTLDRNDDGLPELDADPIPNQFYGAWPWYGVAVHVAGFWLAALLMMERMAKARGDSDTQDHCHRWIEKARHTLEAELWHEKSYLLYHDRTGHRRSETILANQFAGQWCTHLHSLPGAFPKDHVSVALSTVKDTCQAATSHGAINAVQPDGSADHSASPHSDGIFTGECLCLAATMVYEGRSSEGQKIAERLMRAIVLKNGAGWELPNILDVEGRAIHGNDFYQLMILWALPMALKNEGIHETCSDGGFMHRILQAAAGT